MSRVAKLKGPPQLHLAMTRCDETVHNQRQRDSGRRHESPSRGGDPRPRAAFSQGPGGGMSGVSRSTCRRSQQGLGCPAPQAVPQDGGRRRPPGHTGLLSTAAVASHAPRGPQH